MAEHPLPVFRTTHNLLLIGTMAVYESQYEASQRIPLQWRAFRDAHPLLGSHSGFRGASPCTADGKMHYLTGVAQEEWDGSAGGVPLTLETGEYAVVQVHEAARLSDTWTWLLGMWLPSSGRLERKAPEFEKYTDISETGRPVGPVEIWIPLEPHVTS